MAKELPYFQFEPAEYLTKDISFCSLGAQGLFINVCAYYWQRQCELTKTQFLRRLNCPKEFDELVSEGIIDLDNDVIKVKFLDAQFEKATMLSKTNSTNGSKGGRPRKENPIKTELKPNQKPIESQNISESKGIREDKIIEDNKKEDEIIELKEKTKRFVPPSLNEVIEYCQERKNLVDPSKFTDYYTSNGWMVGKNKMKDWKASIRTWEKNNTNFNQNQNGTERPKSKADQLNDDFERVARECGIIPTNPPTHGRTDTGEFTDHTEL